MQINRNGKISHINVIIRIQKPLPVKCQHGIHWIKTIRNPIKKFISCISHRGQFISVQLHRSAFLQHHDLIFNLHPDCCRIDEILNQLTRPPPQTRYHIYIFSHINNSISGYFLTINNLAYTLLF